MSDQKYFIQADLFGDSWRVVYREVETTDPTTGIPLTFKLVALPETYATSSQAQAAADQLNAGDEQGDEPGWGELNHE